jgi:hypothetical protein
MYYWLLAWRYSINHINGENVCLNTLGWLNHQLMMVTMQMLYVQKLQPLGYQ